MRSSRPRVPEGIRGNGGPHPRPGRIAFLGALGEDEIAEMQLAVLGERWSRVRAVYVDNTKHGDYIIQDMAEAGVPAPEGVTFTQPSKMEMAQLLKQRMVEGTFRMPFDRETLDEFNVEKYELTKTGKISFSHPEGTHDDRFWALALAVLAAERAPPPPSRPIARVI